MLVKFAIEPELLDNADTAQITSLQRNWWTSFGILVDSNGMNSVLNSGNYRTKLGNAHRDIFQKASERFKDDGWPLWTATDNIDWQNMSTRADLAEYQDTFSLALIEDTRALEFDIPEDGGDFCGGVEAIRFPHAGLSTKFYETRVLSQKAIQRETPFKKVKDLWQERFSPLASHTNGNQQITIVDRYTASNIYQGNDELFNLLKFIHSDSPGCRITIYSSDRDAINQNEIRRRLDDEIAQLHLSGNGIRSITLFLCYDDVFGRYGHDRYIRFAGFTCVIGIGIEIFRGDNVDTETEFSLKSPEHIQTYRDREQKLKGKWKSRWQWKS